MKKETDEPLVINDETYAPALAALESLCFPGGWSSGQYAKVLGDSHYLVLALQSGDAVLAYAVLYHVLDELEILNIGTHPEHRLCPQYGIRRIVLDVRPSNTPAVRLYGRFNFVEVGRRPRYYSPDGEDALLLEWVRPE